MQGEPSSVILAKFFLCCVRIILHLKLTLEYDGTNYHGWQIQSAAPTVQGAVEAALQQLFSSPVRVRVAGRTDTGVHALGQVIAFIPPKAVDLPRFHRSLNAILPADVSVKLIEEVSTLFNPRHDATSRVYQYRMWNYLWRSPIWARHSWHIPYLLNSVAMNDAASLLVGDHDFSSFQGADSTAYNPRRTVLRSVVRREGEFLIYDVEARSFLRHMVRNIVGTLVDVGRGMLGIDDFAAILAARDRTRAGLNAPPQGLFLVEVKYENLSVSKTLP
jgi:tRNA pseudouridine38-40 synthase